MQNKSGGLYLAYAIRKQKSFLGNAPPFFWLSGNKAYKKCRVDHYLGLMFHILFLLKNLQLEISLSNAFLMKQQGSKANDQMAD